MIIALYVIFRYACNIMAFTVRTHRELVFPGRSLYKPYLANLLDGEVVEIIAESPEEAQRIRLSVNSSFRRWLKGGNKKLRTRVRNTSVFLSLENP